MYTALVAELDDATLERMGRDLGDLFFDALAVEIEEAKIRVPMCLDRDQEPIAEFTAGLLRHTLGRDDNGLFLLPTKSVALGRRLEALRDSLESERVAA